MKDEKMKDEKKTGDSKTPRKVDQKKLDAIKAAIAQIEKNYGEGAIMKMGDNHKILIETVSSGSLSLDKALGGGIPRGRIVEIYGPESSGKTTLASHIIASFQKEGGQAAFIDAEHALDISYARKIGVDVDNLLLSQPDHGEQALETVETLVRSGAIDVIVVDSVAALTPRAEIEGMMGDSHMGLQARLMSQALRKITAIVAKTKCTVVFLNQMRMKIGVIFGNPETTTGGNALKFYATIRLDIRRIDKITESSGSSEISGNRTRVKVVKNKIAPPFKKAEFDIMFDEGISFEGDMIDCGVECGVVTKAGSFYSYGDVRLGQGRENSKVFLRENSKILKKLEAEIRKTF